MRNHCAPDCVLPLCIDLSFIPKFNHYEAFSFYANGCANTFLVVFGCIGNALMMRSIRQQKRQKRLRARLFMLCCWDTLLLVCVFGFSGAPCLHHNMTRLYGPTSYLLRFLQPAGSIATTASVWEIFAITAERYWAVTQPFKPLKNSHTAIVRSWVAIVTGSVLLNLPDAIEMKFIRCVHFVTGEVHPQLSVDPLSTEPWYGLCVKLIPELIFRSPVPFLFIAFLTIGTLYGRHNRPNLGAIRQRGGLATPFKLTVLSLKFLLCNSLFVAYKFIKWANLGRGKSLLYLGDVSNILVTLQSATNWILFIPWRSTGSKKNKSSISRGNIFDCEERDKLRLIWSNLTADQRRSLARNLCQIAIKYNMIHYGGEAFCLRVDDFLEDLVGKLVSNRSDQACRGLRRWGVWCKEHKLKVGNECWLEARKCLTDGLRDDGRVTQKLAGFIISQVKHGIESSNASAEHRKRKETNSIEASLLLGSL